MGGDDFLVQHLVDSADWVADHERSLCYVCTRPFGTFRRKHHCRMCGEIVCNNCTLHKDAHVDPAMGCTRVRVCISCVVSNSQPRPTPREATEASRMWVQTHLHSPTSGKSGSEPDAEASETPRESKAYCFELKAEHLDMGVESASSCPRRSQRSFSNVSGDGDAQQSLAEWTHPWPPPPVAADEGERLRALQALRVLDSSPEKPFDMICDLAKARLSCPMAAVSFLAEHRQWFKASVGLAHKMIPRKIAFCAYTVAQREPVVVLDTLQDRRFEHNPLVSGAAGVRFYAAAPILDPSSGHAVGSVFVLDTRPRESCDIAILERLAYAAGENLPQGMVAAAVATAHKEQEAVAPSNDMLELSLEPQERQRGPENSSDGSEKASRLKSPEGSQDELHCFHHGKAPPSPALSASTASLSSVTSRSYSESAASPCKPLRPSTSTEANSAKNEGREEDATPTAMTTSLDMGKTSSGEQMEVLLMRLLTQNTETQQQLAVQQISLSTTLGQHSDQISKLMSDFARMEAKMEAKVGTKTEPKVESTLESKVETEVVEAVAK